ncbi:MAG: bifunctional phosphopantothenoylcysteine decarboxylase/phosphopantothenate--cysteine ligase CoaBC [Fluviicola sp.]|nr:bifunctional phosphopantothenoylcysteine decarboxylase/phosphopantothenate--cysteine ligase CoaBC [Fluviicola sp.]
MKNKRILLGITGGIAAYKITSLIRLLIKSGAEVKCILTPASCDFISPLTVATLSKNPVGIEFWNKEDGSWNNHVEYGLWADLFVVAPLTTNTLSKMANGACDNLLLATYFSMKCQTIVAPAMDLDMYAHPSTKRNLSTLEQDGVKIIPVEKGELASGLVGEGRMAEPETIFQSIVDFFQAEKDLDGQTILITAGPTYESIDPVRFIGNHSSGKMGYAIAENCLNRGANVILVSGPTKLTLSHPNLKLIAIQSAEQMFSEVQKEWKNSTVGIFSAAVADYRPEVVADQKIKKKDDSLTLTLVKNPDILSWAGANKSGQQVLVGFALETTNAIENGKEKLSRKNLDLIVVNTLEDEGAGFGHDTNKISIIDNHNKITRFELMTKSQTAIEIVDYLKKYI